MQEALCVLFVAGLLGACSSSGALVDKSEEYKGPQTAAVAPVSNGGGRQDPPGEGFPVDVQRSIQRQLDGSGIFAAVVALEHADEENEAEIIIEPALVGPTGYGGNPVDLRVRVTEKTKRRIVLDERYQGDDPMDTLKVAIMELEDDLGDRYKR